MIAVICTSALLISILSAVVFHCSLIFSAAAAAVSAALLIVELFLFKGSAVKSALVFTGAIAVLCVCIWAPPRPTEYGLLDHAALFEKYSGAVSDGKKDKAETLLTELSEKYGTNDNERYIRVCSLTESGDIGKAEEIAASFDDKNSQLYLLAEEEIINKKYVSEEELSDALLPLFVNAADKNPDWWYPAKVAGGLLFDKGEYSKAEYYLTRALVYTDEDDPELLYYLGAAECEQELYDKGLPLLSEAYELGISEDYYSNIAYYVQRSGQGGKADD